MKKNIRKNFGLLFVLLLFLAVIPTSQGQRDNGRASDITVSTPIIAVDISNSFVTVTTSLTLKNGGSTSREFEYNMDIPDEAFLTNLTLKYNNSTYYGEVKEAKQAQLEYEEAVNQSKSAIKLEKLSVSRFSMTLNLEPGKMMDLSYTYNMFLVKELGGFEFSITPSNHLPEFTKIGAELSFNVESSTMIISDGTINLDRNLINYKGSKRFSLDVQLSNDKLDQAAGVKFETMDTQTNGTILFHEEEENRYFVHTFAPGLNELGGKPLKKDIVFIVDRSGSMQGDKMDQTKSAFGVIVDQLSLEYDRFNIISFSNDFTVWKDNIQNPTNTSIQEAKDYINTINAGGGTNIVDSLEQGLEIFVDTDERMKIIVFLTDGNPTAGNITSAPAICEYIKNLNSDRTSIFSLGVGYDMDFEFLERLSFMNYARAYRIDDSKDMSEQITSFYDTISVPLIFDLELKYENAMSVYQRHAPYLFQGQEHCVVGKVKNTANDLVFQGSGSAAGNSSMDFTGSFLSVERVNQFIETFWAFMHIRWCEEKMLMEDDPSIYEQELIDTAIEHQIVTEYTTMILVVKEEEKEEGEVDDDEPDNTAEDLDDDNDLTYDDTGTAGGNQGGSSKFDYEDDDSSHAGAGDSSEKEDSSGMGGFGILFVLTVTLSVIIIIIVLYARRKE